MAMPRDLVLVRHGESEANVMQRRLRAAKHMTIPKDFIERHNAHMRLTERGREQARSAGRWILSQFPEGFDGYFVSSYIRARETAGSLAINGAWRIDDRWGERDWGEFSALTEAERKAKYKLSCMLREQHAWYWCPPGGRSLSSVHSSDVKSALGTLHREYDDKKVLIVTHGEKKGVARYDLEHMDPDSWLEEEHNPAHKMENALATHYTRQNPETGEVVGHLGWRRAICAWDETKSWDNGEWVAIPPRPTYSDTELLASAEPYTRLLTNVT